MEDHPDLRDLGGPVFHQVQPGRDRLYAAAASAITWLTVIGVMAAAPCIVWLWRWAL